MTARASRDHNTHFGIITGYYTLFSGKVSNKAHHKPLSLIHIKMCIRDRFQDSAFITGSCELKTRSFIQSFRHDVIVHDESSADIHDDGIRDRETISLIRGNRS